jgi:hypothetical protein
MKPRRQDRRDGRAVLVPLCIVAILAIAACGTVPAPTTPPSAAPVEPWTRITFEYWGPDGDPAPSELAAATRATLEARAKAIDARASVAIGADGHLVLEAPGDIPPEARQGLLARASFAVVPLPPDRFGTVETQGAEVLLAGQAVPANLEPLLTIDDVEAAGVTRAIDENGQQVLSIKLRTAGAAALATWSRGHVGEFLAIAVDGIVKVVPVVMAPLTDGTIVLSGPPGQWPSDADLPALRGAFPVGVTLVEVAVERIPAP